MKEFYTYSLFRGACFRKKIIVALSLSFCKWMMGISFCLVASVVSAQVVLPVVEDFSFVSGSGIPTMPDGFVQSGLDGYSGALKFDDTGDFLTLQFSETPKTLMFDIGVNNSFTGSIPSDAIFSVEESDDGNTWNTLSSYTAMLGGTKTLYPNSTSRFIKWVYTTKPSGTNIALKNVQLTDAENPSPFYRSKKDGNWNDHNIWEISADGNNWADAASSYPTNLSGGIIVRNDHIITLTNDATAKLLTIDAGGTLTNTNSSGGYQLTIDDDGTSANDFIINGTYILFGTAPAFNSGAIALVNNNGLVRADDNAGPEQSDAFASSLNVIFKTGAVFEWNNTSAFATSGITYFPNSSVADIPVFKITNVAASVRSGSTTTFNGIVEVDKDFTFTGGSVKNFRNGITGSATLTQNTTSGNSFQISSKNAILGGASLRINLSSPMNLKKSVVVPIDSSITISGGKIDNNSSENIFTINGTLDMTDQQITNTNGAVIVNGIYRTSISGGFSSGAFTNSSIPSGTITVNPSSTIELYALEDQNLNTRSDFANLIFSGSGVKTPGSSFSPNGTITIKDNAILDCSGHNIGGASTNLTMTDNSRLIVGTVSTQPAMEGTYNLTGGVIEFKGSSTTAQTIKGKTNSSNPIVYKNIEISGSKVASSNHDIFLNENGGSFTIKPNGCFEINTFSIKSYNDAINNTNKLQKECEEIVEISKPNDEFKAYDKERIS
ncbi:MAG: hypothetical protein ABI280_00750, partial [Ginsengibacter sp.]